MYSTPEWYNQWTLCPTIEIATPMFMAAPFRIARKWNQPWWPLKNEQNEGYYVHNEVFAQL